MLFISGSALWTRTPGRISLHSSMEGRAPSCVISGFFIFLSSKPAGDERGIFRHEIHDRNFVRTLAAARECIHAQRRAAMHLAATYRPNLLAQTTLDLSQEEYQDFATGGEIEPVEEVSTR